MFENLDSFDIFNFKNTVDYESWRASCSHHVIESFDCDKFLKVMKQMVEPLNDNIHSYEGRLPVHSVMLEYRSIVIRGRFMRMGFQHWEVSPDRLDNLKKACSSASHAHDLITEYDDLLQFWERGSLRQISGLIALSQLSKCCYKFHWKLWHHSFSPFYHIQPKTSLSELYLQGFMKYS